MSVTQQFNASIESGNRDSVSDFFRVSASKVVPPIAADDHGFYLVVFPDGEVPFLVRCATLEDLVSELASIPDVHEDAYLLPICASLVGQLRHRGQFVGLVHSGERVLMDCDDGEEVLASNVSVPMGETKKGEEVFLYFGSTYVENRKAYRESYRFVGNVNSDGQAVLETELLADSDPVESEELAVD